MLAPNLEPTVASVFAPRTIIEPDGTVEGYASLFGAIDQARDMVMQGAFADTLSLRGPRRIPMLFQHDPAEPVGVWLELREDSRGLFARGRLIPEVARARELLALLRGGAIDGLSIGFKTVKGAVDPRSRIRRLIAVDLWEISIVTFPLLAGARVRAVKEATSPPVSRARTRSPSRLQPTWAHQTADLGQARDRMRAWGRLVAAADVPAAATPSSRARATPRRQLVYRWRDGTLSCGSVRAWRGCRDHSIGS